MPCLENEDKGCQFSGKRIRLFMRNGISTSGSESLTAGEMHAQAGVTSLLSPGHGHNLIHHTKALPNNEGFTWF